MTKQAIISLAVVGTVACAAVFALSSFEAPASTNLYGTSSDFATFTAKYGKNYGTVEEFKFRENLYNAKRVAFAKENARNANTYTVGINKFSDWTDAEYKKILGYKKSTATHKNYKVLDTSNVSNDIDWRSNGAVTDVKNQGQCGSCWSFSTTGALEGAHAISSGQLISLSEQQLVDCSDQNSGCNGGSMDLAFQYTQSTPLDTEDQYPYTATQGTCAASGSGPVSATGYSDITPNAPDQLRAAVNAGPVSIAIEADQQAFQGYAGGILNSADCGTNLDHGVLIVGHGSEGGQDYWIVKNSWGADWGESGFIRIADVDGEGICGINMAAVQPTA